MSFFHGRINAGYPYPSTNEEERPIRFRFHLIVCAVGRMSDFQDTGTRRSLGFEGESMPIRNQPGSCNSEPRETLVADLRGKESMNLR
jgi:hypothetical protein